MTERRYNKDDVKTNFIDVALAAASSIVDAFDKTINCVISLFFDESLYYDKLPDLWRAHVRAAMKLWLTSLPTQPVSLESPYALRDISHLNLSGNGAYFTDPSKNVRALLKDDVITTAKRYYDWNFSYVSPLRSETIFGQDIDVRFPAPSVMWRNYADRYRPTYYMLTDTPSILSRYQSTWFTQNIFTPRELNETGLFYFLSASLEAKFFSDVEDLSRQLGIPINVAQLIWDTKKLDRFTALYTLPFHHQTYVLLPKSFRVFDYVAGDPATLWKKFNSYDFVAYWPHLIVKTDSASYLTRDSLLDYLDSDTELRMSIDKYVGLSGLRITHKGLDTDDLNPESEDFFVSGVISNPQKDPDNE